MPKDAKPVTTSDVMAALRSKYSGTAWAFFEEVSNGTGARGGQAYADAMVMSLWPSRGLEAYGFEVKVSRADWRKELDNPKKAEILQRYCTRWWVVSGNKCVLETELPKKWGLLELRGKSLHVKKEAPRLKAKAWDQTFIAALLRRAAENQSRLRTQARQEGYAAGAERGPAEHAARLASALESLDALQKRVATFEETSGVKISSAWNYVKIGEAVRLVLAHLQYSRGIEEGIRMLEDTADFLRESAKRADRNIESQKQMLAALQNLPTKEEKEPS